MTDTAEYIVCPPLIPLDLKLYIYGVIKSQLSRA
jgi:hypothetical protein